MALILVTPFFLAQLRKQGRQGEVMATVDGRKIYREEVDKYYRTQTAGSPNNPGRAGYQSAAQHFAATD
jgi:hypothetical protein